MGRFSPKITRLMTEHLHGAYKSNAATEPLEVPPRYPQHKCITYCRRVLVLTVAQCAAPPAESILCKRPEIET